MRGLVNKQQQLFGYVNIEEKIKANDPIRNIKNAVDELILELDPEFDAVYSDTGRPSIPPEHLLKASILQYIYAIPSERNLVEQIDFNLKFRWFIGLGIDDPIWDHSTFTKQRNRILDTDLAKGFFYSVLELAKKSNLISTTHFSVDGTLLEAWASVKSFKPKKKEETIDTDSDGGNNCAKKSKSQTKAISKKQSSTEFSNQTQKSVKECVNTEQNECAEFRGEKLSNETHESTTDPDARLAKKSAGTGAKLAHHGHVLMENRNGLAVDIEVNQFSGTSEREAALKMIARQRKTQHKTLGADKGYDAEEFIEALREQGVTPHIARKKYSKIDDRTTKHEGYEISLRKRKRIEEIFGWSKINGGMQKLKVRGQEKVTHVFTICVACYNLLRICNLRAAA